MELRVRSPPEAWMSLPCQYCVLSSAGFCDGPIPLPEKSKEVCVCACVRHRVLSGSTRTLYTYKWVGRRGQTEKGSKKENKSWWKGFLTCRVSFDVTSHKHEISKWLELCWMTSVTWFIVCTSTWSESKPLCLPWSVIATQRHSPWCCSFCLIAGT
jgi:hypothetical protein